MKGKTTMRHDHVYLRWKALTGYCAYICWLLATTSPGVAQEDHPLKPADTSSPRATVNSFVENINNLYQLIKQDEKQKTTATAFKQAILAKRAISCLDLSKLDLDVAEDVGKQRAVLLSEILDRLGVPKSIPDAKDKEVQETKRWRFPNTEITIVQIVQGPRQGEFLFSAETVRQIPEFYQLVKHLPYQPGTVLREAYKKLTAKLVATGKLDNPLSPGDTTSPRATLKTFVNNMTAAYTMYFEFGLSRTTAVKQRELWARAIRCLDIGEVAPNLVMKIGTEKAVLLMEVLNRTELPPYEQIPGAADMKKEKRISWSIPGTEITLSQVEKGLHQGEFRFTMETVANLDDFYERVKQLPYKEGAIGESFYDIYVHAPGWMIPLSWIQSLPAWMKTVLGNQPLWKWAAIVVTLLFYVVVLVFTFRLGGRRPGAPPAPFWKRLVFPSSGIILGLVLQPFLIYQIRPIGYVAPWLQFALIVVVFLSAVWLMLMLASALPNVIINSPRIGGQGPSAQIIRIAFRILSLVALVILILWASYEMGVPLTPVLAGLGIGGVAIALALQNSIENLIGGLNLFADRPVQVGDFCRFGDKIGTVEEIGLRSTRVRTLNDTVVSIPNSTFSKHELENYSKRRKIRYHPRISIRAETTPDQIRYILVEVHKLLYSHPMVLSESARIRFAEFGEGSLHLDVFAYVDVSAYAAFLEVAEDLNLRVLEIVAASGSGLAMPAELNYMEGLDENRAKEVAKQVDEWREHGQLHLPRLPEDKIDELRGSLQYPPQGSSNPPRSS